MLLVAANNTGVLLRLAAAMAMTTTDEVWQWAGVGHGQGEEATRDVSWPFAHLHRCM
jgi:hypothetical protein